MTRIIFATDVHGSELTFRKLISAAKMHKANVVILGGDMTGKIIVPIIKQPDGKYTAKFLGNIVKIDDEKELEQLENNIRLTGYYPYRTTLEEYQEISKDSSKQYNLFTDLMIEQILRWDKLAEQHLKPLGIKFYVCPGNDDRIEVDEAIDSKCSFLINTEGKIIWIDDFHEMISTGWSNITPFGSPKEMPEDELLRKIENMISKLKNVENSIFNLHCPPIDTTLDKAPKLDKDLRPSLRETISAGSVAVRKVIEKYQPLLGLHGHIHESRGIEKIGRTLCINPGSEYTEGILRAVIIDLSENKVKSYLFISG
ncbi:MAG: metallophosphoesterase [archaeon YNP-LCB-003-016]|uniref:metallophosphoesterase family protein n=1 Tax=Candidatus Culexarchaeum yellowstonense TaxID=2928963 RepID=UPI0026E93435|nr:metallophosphoesterase [Candidatus Culexarchaeum yellowstonense]MCR6691863.1 metallophosphoesterase [Candidatus Culexarchaeum yellowstonense]